MQTLFNFVKSSFIKRSLRQQQKFALTDLTQWGLSINPQGHISVNNTDVTDLISHHGSPLLVVNRNQLIKDANSIHNATKQTGADAKVVYSYKTNCIPGILNEIHGTGIGAEVISPYELWLAEQLNVPGEKIVFNGVNKTDESITRAIERDILAINIDSLSEIDRIVSAARRLNRKARVGVRLGFIPKAQFGLEIESGEAMEACRRIKQHSKWLELNMIHFCAVSNAKNASAHCRFAEKSLKFIHALKAHTGMTIRYLDIGGGIGVPTSHSMTNLEYGLYRLFGSLPKPPDPNAFEDIYTFTGRIGKTVHDTSARLGIETPSLIVEPGRFVTSRCEFLLSTVLSIKEKTNGTKFAITDAGRHSLTFPCEFEHHTIFTADQGRQRKKEPYNLMGRICTAGDFVMKNVLLPHLHEGDVLVTMDAGAYFSSFSTNFAFPRPAIIMVSNDGTIQRLRHAETFQHLTAMDTTLHEQHPPLQAQLFQTALSSSSPSS